MTKKHSTPFWKLDPDLAKGSDTVAEFFGGFLIIIATLATFAGVVLAMLMLNLPLWQTVLLCVVAVTVLVLLC